MNPGPSRALRSALRQTRGALRKTNEALWPADLPEAQRRVLEAVRLTQLELQAVYVGLLTEASERRAA